MIRAPFALTAPFRSFLRQEDGVATVDWVIVTAGATGAALIALEIAGGAVTGYTSNVRDEVQTPYFDTSWTSTLEIPPQEYWEDRDPMVPATEDLIQTGIFDEIIDIGSDDDPSDPSDPNYPTDPNIPVDPPAPPDPPPPPSDPNDPSTIPTLVIPTSPVVGCPTIDFAGPVSTRTGGQLDNNDLNVDVTAGGATQAGSCSGIPGWGFFNANPSITLFLSGMQDMKELEIETRDSCDTVLLIRDPLGNFYFDDDGGASHSQFASRFKFTPNNGFDMGTLNGRIDIWVGTYAGNTCNNVTVEIDTID